MKKIETGKEKEVARNFPQVKLDKIVKDTFGADGFAAEWQEKFINPNKKLEDYEHEVIQDPNRKGGQPVIKGTRWPVWDIFGEAELDGIQKTADRFLTLTPDMVEFAVKYVLSHPEVAEFYADEED